MTPLCAAETVEAGRPVLARLSQTVSVILLRSARGEVIAWRNACPHMGIELDWEPRRLLTRDGRHLRCTGHDAWFDPETGTCVKGPCRGETLAALPVRVENSTVVLDD